VVLGVAVFGGMFILILLLARMHPGSGSDLLDWDPSERMQRRMQAEYEDAHQLLAEHNRRRRERGLPEHTEEEFRASLTRSAASRE